MAPDEMAEVIATDVLILGGGLAGCMAAMKAREHGVDVVIMDKEAIRRSGDAACGMDHFPNVAHQDFKSDQDMEALVVRLGQRVEERLGYACLHVGEERTGALVVVKLVLIHEASPWRRLAHRRSPSKDHAPCRDTSDTWRRSHT